MAHNVEKLAAVFGVAPLQILPSATSSVPDTHPAVNNTVQGELIPVSGELLDSFGIKKEIDERFPVRRGKIRYVLVNAEAVDIDLAVQRFVPAGEQIAGPDDTFQLVFSNLATKVGDDRIIEFETDLIQDDRPQDEPDPELDRVLESFGEAATNSDIIVYVQDVTETPDKSLRGQLDRLQATSLVTRVRGLSRGDRASALQARRVFVLGSHQAVALSQPPVEPSNNIIPFPVSSSPEQPRVSVSFPNPAQPSGFGNLEDVIAQIPKNDLDKAA